MGSSFPTDLSQSNRASSPSPMTHAATPAATQSPIAALLEQTLDCWLAPASEPRASFLSSHCSGVIGALPPSSTNVEKASSFVPSSSPMMLVDATTKATPGMTTLSPTLKPCEADPVANTLEPTHPSKPKATLLQDSTNKAAESTAIPLTRRSLKRAATTVNVSSSPNDKRLRTEPVPTASVAGTLASPLSVVVSPLPFDGARGAESQSKESFKTAQESPDRNTASAVAGMADVKALMNGIPTQNDFDLVERELLDEFAATSFYHECQPNCMLIRLPRTTDAPAMLLRGHFVARLSPHDDGGEEEAWRLFDDADLETDTLLIAAPVVKRVDVRRSKPRSPAICDTKETVPLLDKRFTEVWSLLNDKELETEADLIEAEVNLSLTTDMSAKNVYADMIDLAPIERLTLTRRCQCNASRYLCALEVDKILQSGNVEAA